MGYTDFSRNEASQICLDVELILVRRTYDSLQGILLRIYNFPSPQAALAEEIIDDQHIVLVSADFPLKNTSITF